MDADRRMDDFLPQAAHDSLSPQVSLAALGPFDHLAHSALAPCDPRKKVAPERADAAFLTVRPGAVSEQHGGAVGVWVDPKRGPGVAEVSKGAPPSHRPSFHPASARQKPAVRPPCCGTIRALARRTLEGRPQARSSHERTAAAVASIPPNQPA